MTKFTLQSVWIVASWICILYCPFASAQFPFGFQLSGLGTSLGSFGVSSTNGTKIGVQITGLQNLTAAQQQAFITALSNSLITALTGVSGFGNIAGSLGGQPYGLQLGNYLGTSGLAAQAAQSFANPFGYANSNPLGGIFGLPGSAPSGTPLGLGLPSGFSTLGGNFGSNGHLFRPNVGLGGPGSQQLTLASLGALLQSRGAAGNTAVSTIVGSPVFLNGK
ncbi:hypothetical protein BV898_01710 [Hypsibius exemplaris]|uniref:Uncharacterized protein n=1 Tax=Hypsibius exemplaris TaxID=2072580 RepID=A0A1W0XBJ2_HYPEX|nr:hypothetical protein BV898_01710 [Hypsibius exemplaris]